MKFLFNQLIRMLVLCSVPGLLVAGNLPDGPYVSTSASAIEEVDPDFAVIDLQFRVVEATAEAAREATDQAQQQLIELLSGFEDAVRDQRLESTQFGEEFEFDPEQRRRLPVGFYGAFSYRLEVDDFDALPKLHYQLAGLEWASLDDPRFEVDDDEAVQRVARLRALAKAGDRARALAEAQGARLGPVWGILYEPMHDLAGRSPGVIGGNARGLDRVRVTGSTFSLPLEPHPVRFEATVGVVFMLETAVE